MHLAHAITAILPCNNLDASEAFYGRLDFSRPLEEKRDAAEDNYRILTNGKGGMIHLTEAVEGWLNPEANPFGLYLYCEDIDRLAADFSGETLEPNGPEEKSWGMFEFSLSDPDGTLVRIGWPSRLRP